LAGCIAFLAVAARFGQSTIPSGVGLVLAAGAFALAPRLAVLASDPSEQTQPIAALPVWDLACARDRRRAAARAGN